MAADKELFCGFFKASSKELKETSRWALAELWLI